MSSRVHGRAPGRTIRFRFYVNETLVHSSDMTAGEVERAVEIGESQLRPADRWVMVMEDLTGQRPPWFYGNDDTFGPKIARELFPGMKLPEGEMGWQKQHGVRVPPETGLADLSF